MSARHAEAEAAQQATALPLRPEDRRPEVLFVRGAFPERSRPRPLPAMLEEPAGFTASGGFGMSAYPQIIVSLGRVKAAPGVLVVDHFNGRFWLNGKSLRNAAKSPQRPTISFRIIAALLCAGPGLIHYDDLCQAVWGDDETGGPGDIKNNIWARVSKNRSMLDALGIAVNGKHGWGFMVSYRNADEMAVLKAKRAVRAKKLQLGHDRARGRRAEYVNHIAA